MYYPVVRFCNDPSRAKYALCLIPRSGRPFVRTYLSYERYNRALLGYLSKPDWFAVSYVQFRGNWIYSSTHTLGAASPFLLEAARKTAAACVESYLW